MKLYYFDENDEEYKEYEPEKQSCTECIKSVSNGGICSWRGADGHACANFVPKEYGFETLCSKCSEFNKSCIGATDVTECKSFKEKEVKEEEGDIKEDRTCVDCSHSHYNGGKCLASHYNNKICGGFEQKIDKKYFRELFEKNGGDNVDHPNHYLGTESLECIDVMEFALGEDGFAYYCIGNIFKYLWRHDKKNGEEDLEKARKYLQFLELRKSNLSEPVRKLAERVAILYESVI